MPPPAPLRHDDAATAVDVATTVDGRTRSRRATALPPEERRRRIIEAALPVLLQHGTVATTRQIAEAAGIAEGTIFRVFPDKDALLDAVIAAALDPAPLEARLADVDRTLGLEARLVQAVRVLQERVTSVWQLVSTVGVHRPGSRHRPRPTLVDSPALAALLGPDAERLRYEPVAAARRLRALAIASSHPALAGGNPLTAEEIVSLFLDGVRRRA